jgi:hypothetical protein
LVREQEGAGVDARRTGGERIEVVWFEVTSEWCDPRLLQGEFQEIVGREVE